MNGVEILTHIYEDANMSVFSLSELLKELKEKDNRITSDIENILKGYERYQKESKKLLEHYNEKGKVVGMMGKMMAKEGVKKEVKKDNSDASIADMLIKGISMGTLDMEKKMKKYSEKTDKKIMEFACEFKKFGEDNITALKKYI